MNKTTQKIKVGIIGGSGMDDPKLLTDQQTINIDTPFGQPSSAISLGKLAGVDVAIISRHGKNHTLMPGKVPYQANIWALKQAGCSHILATTACGSLQDDFKPGDFVFIDQFIDFTKHRNLTFYQDHVIHTPMAEPFCPALRERLGQAAQELKLPHHIQGTIITIEGPRFSTRAESRLFRSWQADVINMSTVPEVTLAREIGICYQSIAMVTDYDSWKEKEAAVTWEMVMEQMNKNVGNIKQLLLTILPKIDFYACDCKKTTADLAEYKTKKPAE